MKEVEVLAPLANLDKHIELETARLQKQKDNEKLPDPSEAGLFTVERITPVTPAAVAQSVKVLVRNAALKNIGAENLADETNARENIAEAEEKTYEAPAKKGEKVKDLPPKEETSPRVPSKAKK